MALSAATNWDVRTSGSDSNGGGFVLGASGTDYSQQNSAQFSGTDLTSVSSLVVSSASHNFVSTDVGNIVQITSSTSGFTTGFYQIVSVSANQATFDRSPGTVGVGGVWAEGGSLRTLAKAFGLCVNANIVWAQAGTYTLTTGLTIPASIYMQLQGYQTTHGDNTGTQPLITTATNSVDMINPGNSASLITLANCSFSNTASVRASCVIASTGGFIQSFQAYNCIFDGFTEALYGKYSGIYCFQFAIFVLCEIKNCTGTGAIWNNGANYLDSCHLHGNTSAGMYFDQAPNSGSFATTCVDTVFQGNQDGILTQENTGLFLKNCTFYNQSRDGVRLNAAGQTTAVSLVNNIFDTNAGYGVNFTSAPGTQQIIAVNNAFRNNTTANWHNYTASVGDIALSGTPFTSAGTDFSLNATAGAGAACRAAGIPGTIPGAGTGYADVGALQHSAGGGGTTVYVIAPNITNLIQEGVV